MSATKSRLDSFRDLQNYTTLKPIIRAYHGSSGFRDSQNYTTLKLVARNQNFEYSFRDSQNYTTLKPTSCGY